MKRFVFTWSIILEIAVINASADASVVGLNEGANIIVGNFWGSKEIEFVQFRGTHARLWRYLGNGSFDRKAYVPWKGYGVGDTSRYLKGDFNGDGHTDVLHCVGDYIHIWFSNDSGSFDVITYTLPSNVPPVTRASSLRAVDIDRDGRHDVVQFAGDRVEIWMSHCNGSYGSFSHKSFVPWPGYAVGDGSDFFKARFLSGQDHLIHMVYSNYVHPWFANGIDSFDVATFSPGYTLEGATRFRVLKKGVNGVADLIHFLDSEVKIWSNDKHGTYSVESWRPEPGYDVQDGSPYIDGDYNGDGRTDLIHIVPYAGNYMHTWLRNTDGTFDVGTYDPPVHWDIVNAKAVITGKINSGDYRDDLFHFTNDEIRIWISQPNGQSWLKTRYSLAGDYEFIAQDPYVKRTGGARVKPVSGVYKLCLDKDYDLVVSICNYGYESSQKIWMIWKENNMVIANSRYKTGVPVPGTCYDTAIKIRHMGSDSRKVQVTVNAQGPNGEVPLPELDSSNNEFTFPWINWGNHPGC